MSIVAISGGFDPIHEGHISLIEDAARYGKVIVILNSDDWLKRKKGYAFMNYYQRSRILMAMKDVSAVYAVDDSDGTACEALRKIKPDYFANGGDRTAENTPELVVCGDLGIKPIFGVGGGKINSSSQLVGNMKDYLYAV
jgi:cytidyltransferase-like protein